MGLANRVVPVGDSLTAAHDLAEQIAGFPAACMKADRASAYRQWDLPLDAALRSEGSAGVHMLMATGEAAEGAKAFSEGAGRHGEF